LIVSKEIGSCEKHQILLPAFLRGISDHAIGHLYFASANRGVAFRRQHGGELLCGKSAVFQIAAVGIRHHERRFYCNDCAFSQNTFEPYQYAQQAILDAAEKQADTG
jgi:hypothetical protein